MSSRLLACLTVLSVLAIAASGLSCLDRNNNSLPWYSFIKYPENKTLDGARYAYLDPNSGSAYQIVNGVHCDELGEPLSNTIAAINSVPDASFNLIVFNDEPPTEPWDPYGAHAKGFIAFDSQSNTGVYIMHSFPKYPNVSAKGYIYHSLPKNTYMYGQNGLCISIDQDILNHLLTDLPVEWPNVYYSSGLFSNMATNSTLMSSMSQFNLLDGETMWHFTKSPNMTGFLYENIIGPYFKVSLAVESWGRPYQNPACPPADTYPTVNVAQIAFNAEDTWDHYSDHAKWAVSVGDGNAVACSCDMNRMDSQEVRGGSCLCTQNLALYEALINIIVLTDKCQA